jgi:hypothetical protein
MNASNESSLDSLATEILIAAAAGPGGAITVAKSIGPTYVVNTHGQDWRADKDPRREADLKAAITQLVSLRLIQDTVGKGEIFKVTQRGYQTVDSLK